MRNDVEAILKNIERFDWGIAETEWLQIQNLIQSNPSEADEILRSVFISFRGFVETRVHSARILLGSNPLFVLETSKKLVSSTNPDNRDSALQILREINSQEAKEIALPLINDVCPNIAFDAIEFLGKDDLLVAKMALDKLTQNSESWVRAKAKSLLELYL